MKTPVIPKRKTMQAKRKGTARPTNGLLAKHAPSLGAHLEDDPTITIAASVPRSVASAAKRRAGAGNFSRFVTSALQHELACSALDEIVDAFVADGGVVDEAMVSAARKLIKD
jgi:hypothetical protein